jgi:hypothetical protein
LARMASMAITTSCQYLRIYLSMLFFMSQVN